MELTMLLNVFVGVVCGLVWTCQAIPLIVEGDIVMDKKLMKIRDEMSQRPRYGNPDEDFSSQLTPRVKRNLYDRRRTHEHRWRHGLVPYIISTELSQPARKAIHAAIRQIEKYTCVRFTPLKYEKDYVEFIMDHGCYSSIGRQGGRQIISVGIGCEYVVHVVHEILHTLGMFHEQTRYDRDLYVQVLWWNVQQGAENNFDIYHHGVIDSLKFPYDFRSATHYDNKDFSKNGQDTIQAIGNPRKRLGNSMGMSKIDMRKILTSYKCYEKKAPKKAPCVNKFSGCHDYRQLCRKRWFATKYCQKECGTCFE